MNTDLHGEARTDTDKRTDRAERELREEALTRKIIGAALEVRHSLGGGFLEKLYENALAIELRAAGLVAEQQKPITVHYKGQVIGQYAADIVVENKVIVELKCVDVFTDVHGAQMLNYLRATGLEVGLLINFGHKVEWKRYVM